MKRAVVLTVGILCLSVAVSAQEEAQYQGWMQTIRATAGSLNENLEAKSGDAAAADARKLAEVFTQVHSFWEKKNISDAMGFAMAARSGFQEVAQLASAGKIEEATEAVGRARSNCGNCHSAHRERDADGAWKIKY